ncbi:MAG TPA: M48 family metalloprotease [Tenuifilaceae bacterium]|nr:M48 family metalloprotease [Tenuifilaceae bacterium]
MKRFLFLSIVSITLFSGCEEGTLNFFTLDQDIQFGQQLDSAILADPATYPILSEDDYPEAYEHLRRIRDELLESQYLRYANSFDWEVKIIHQDVLNAFAAPGGYMYFYTGLIQYLDNEAQFAGVLAHEMAHVDRRHSTEMLTKQYGFSILLSIVLGENPSDLAEIISQLALGGTLLKFSRNNEYEADEYGVKFMYDTEYHARELAGFFEKLEESSSNGRPPEFLSTHPSPENRIEAIEAVWQSLGGKTGETFPGRYQQFKASLPANK